MAANQGTLVIASVRPNNSLDTYPVAIANEIKGGHHNYLTLNDLYNIPILRRQAGMFATVINNPQSAFNNTYVLQEDLITWAYLNDRYIISADLEDVNTNHILKLLIRSPYQFKVDKLYIEADAGSCTVDTIINIGQNIVTASSFIVTVALAPNSPSFGQLGQTTEYFSIEDSDQRTGLGRHYPQQYLSTGIVVRFSIDNPTPNNLPIFVSISDSFINLSHFQGTQLNLQSSGGLNITQSNSGNIVIPANSNYVDITFSLGRNSSEYSPGDQNPVLVVSSSNPNVTVVNPYTTLPFKNNRRLIIKLSKSQSPPNYLTQVSYGAFVPVGYASNVDYTQMPCIYTYDLNTFAVQGLANYYPDIIELFNSQFPPDQKPFKQAQYQSYSLTNPDMSPNRFNGNLYYEVVIQHLIDRANALGKRYVYIVGNATFGLYDVYPNPPNIDVLYIGANSSTINLQSSQAIYDNSSSLNNRFNASIEIAGSRGSNGMSEDTPFTPQLLEPYTFPNSDHKGHMVDVRPMFKYLKSDFETRFSHVFSQFCVKIDTQQSIDQIKFIPSFVPLYLTNDPNTTSLFNIQTVITPTPIPIPVPTPTLTLARFSVSSDGTKLNYTVTGAALTALSGTLATSSGNRTLTFVTSTQASISGMAITTDYTGLTVSINSSTPALTAVVNDLLVINDSTVISLTPTPATTITLKPIILIRADKQWLLQGGQITYTLRLRYKIADRDLAVAQGKTCIFGSTSLTVNFSIFGQQAFIGSDADLNTSNYTYEESSILVPPSGEIQFTKQIPLDTYTPPNALIVGYYEIGLLNSNAFYSVDYSRYSYSPSNIYRDPASVPTTPSLLSAWGEEPDLFEAIP